MNEEIIKNAKSGERVILPEGKYERVCFNETDYGDGYRFSWTAKLRGRDDYWSLHHPWGRTSSTVGVFKTLAGAKRNFVKRMME